MEEEEEAEAEEEAKSAQAHTFSTNVVQLAICKDTIPHHYKKHR